MTILGKNIRKRTIIVLAILIILVGAIFILSGGDGENAEFVVAQKADLVQEVNVTGRVKASQSLDLAFENSGRVAQVYVGVGDKVSIGWPLVRLSAGELLAQLAEAEAKVDAEEARLSELKRGSRPEEVEIKEAELAKSEQDLTNFYSGVSDIINDAFTKADDAVRTKTDILFTNDNTAVPKLSFVINNFAAKVSVESLRVKVTGDFSEWETELLNIFFDSQAENLETALENSRNHLLSIRDFLNETLNALNDATSLSASVLDAYKIDVNTGRTNVNTALSSVNGRLQNIAVQKVTVGKVKQEFELTKAGTANEQVTAQEANVKQAQARVQNIQAQLAKTIIRSPLNGIVTKKDVRVGEIVSVNVPVVSLISESEFEIESFVAESDIAKVNLGNVAKVTLDAYTSEDIFEATILSVDLSETVLEGVATYKTVLQFNSLDSRIKSGMTANVDIRTANKENVIAIPQRSVISKDGRKFVRVMDGGDILEVEISTGLRGSEGEIEIISGLEEGDRVITFIKK